MYINKYIILSINIGTKFWNTKLIGAIVCWISKICNFIASVVKIDMWMKINLAIKLGDRITSCHGAREQAVQWCYFQFVFNAFAVA